MGSAIRLRLHGERQLATWVPCGSRQRCPLDGGTLRWRRSNQEEAHDEIHIRSADCGCGPGNRSSRLRRAVQPVLGSFEAHVVMTVAKRHI